jgi:molybdate transport system permease protein
VSTTAGRAGAAALSALVAGIVLAFLALPIIALFTEVPLRDVPGLLRDPFVRDTLEVTARTNAIANALILGLGTPTAYLIAMRRFPGR